MNLIQKLKWKLIDALIAGEPLVTNCEIHGEGVKEGWSFSSNIPGDEKTIVTPIKSEENNNER
jgi:hypothetical protein